jgi:two-component system chemotaxis response regulator CheY
MSAVRFLVADSSPALQAFSRNLISGYGFESAWVEVASTPEKALASGHAQAPDFLLTDCFSKEATTGLSLVASLKKINADLRWALMSSRMDDEMVTLARQAGAMFQLTKPFGVADIKTAMGQALQQWGQDNHEVGRRMPGYRRPRAVLVMPVVPDVPSYKVGDLVEYQGVRDTVRNVIFRRNELIVQLSNVSGMVPASKLLKP